MAGLRFPRPRGRAGFCASWGDTLLPAHQRELSSRLTVRIGASRGLARKAANWNFTQLQLQFHLTVAVWQEVDVALMSL